MLQTQFQSNNLFWYTTFYQSIIWTLIYFGLDSEMRLSWLGGGASCDCQVWMHVPDGRRWIKVLLLSFNLRNSIYLSTLIVSPVSVRRIWYVWGYICTPLLGTREKNRRLLFKYNLIFYSVNQINTTMELLHAVHGLLFISAVIY